MTRLRSMLVLPLLAVSASSAMAATASGVLAVQATVVAACSVVNSALVFGTVSPAGGTPNPQSGNLVVTCTQGTPFSVGLGDGANASGTQRRMKGTIQAQYLSYELYRDAAATQRFGDSVTSQRLVGLVGLGISANTVPVYGVIAGGQSAPADTYSDTVPITVYY